jgi:dihydropyrimidinase
MGLLIRNGTLVTASRSWEGDVYCADGRIERIQKGLEPAASDEVIDADGLLVFPGGVDPHVHLSLPVAGTVSADDFASGTAAALAGGTTTVIDFVHPERGQDWFEALAARREEAAEAVSDYALHLAITWWGAQSDEWVRRAVEREGIPSFKTYMAYQETVGLRDADLLRAMAAVAEARGTLIVHAEHADLVEYLRDRFAVAGDLAPRFHALSRPPAAEGEATARAIVLAEATGVRLYVFHVTCREAVAAIARARQRGLPVSGETCPHYLLLDDSVYEAPGFEGAQYVCAPPIRPPGHPEALWAALQAGDLEVVSTDHCPFTREQRRLGADDFRRIPGGLAGIEHRLCLLFHHGVGTGRLPVERFVELVSEAPARRFGLYPRKGALAVGSDADLVVWDPWAQTTLSAASQRQRCDTTPFEGFEVCGLPRVVISGGRVAFREGELLARPGAGRYLPRAVPAVPADSRTS